MINVTSLEAELLHTRLRIEDISRQIKATAGATESILHMSLAVLQDTEDDILKELDLVKANEQARGR